LCGDALLLPTTPQPRRADPALRACMREPRFRNVDRTWHPQISIIEIIPFNEAPLTPAHSLRPLASPASSFDGRYYRDFGSHTPASSWVPYHPFATDIQNVGQGIARLLSCRYAELRRTPPWSIQAVMIKRAQRIVPRARKAGSIWCQIAL
jgi:hypothetical protein